jgi:exonuclease VII large subunit
MKNLAQLQLQTQRQKGKTKPMVSARTARGVPQMRKLAKQLTGRQEGGLMSEDARVRTQLQTVKNALQNTLKNKDRLAQQDINRAEQLLEKIGKLKEENQDTQAGREAARKLQQKIKSFLDKSIGFTKRS